MASACLMMPQLIALPASRYALTRRNRGYAVPNEPPKATEDNIEECRIAAISAADRDNRSERSVRDYILLIHLFRCLGYVAGLLEDCEPIDEDDSWMDGEVPPTDIEQSPKIAIRRIKNFQDEIWRCELLASSITLLDIKRPILTTLVECREAVGQADVPAEMALLDGDVQEATRICQDAMRLARDRTFRELSKASALCSAEATILYPQGCTTETVRSAFGIPIAELSLNSMSLLELSSFLKTLPNPSLPDHGTAPLVLSPTTERSESKLSIGSYEHILAIIDRLSRNIERNPSTFFDMKKEQIRDLILVDLNGHYDGAATGETFNNRGKTDILLCIGEESVFVAECKFWRGQRALHAAIDQILRYLTWRDTKAALVLFSRNVRFTDVLAKTEIAVSKHPNFKKVQRKVSETHVRYLFQHKDDPARDLCLSVQAFSIPKRPK